MKNTAGKDDRQRKLSGSSVLSSSSFKRIREESNTCHFLQKSLLGGILIFEISLHEPFFQAKLYALESARLQAKASSGMISQVFIFIKNLVSLINHNLKFSSSPSVFSTKVTKSKS
jgi:hypothetical protein